MKTQTQNGAGHELVKVARAHDQAEAELIQGLLEGNGIGSVVRRAPGFDVPDFLAAGPRDVLVAHGDIEAAREVIPPGEPAAPRSKPPRVRGWVLVAVALLPLGLYLCIDLLA